MPNIKPIDFYSWYDYSTGYPDYKYPLKHEYHFNQHDIDPSNSLHVDEDFHFWTEDECQNRVYFSTIVGSGLGFCYEPKKHRAWLFSPTDEGFSVNFYVESWEEVEQLRYQINRGERWK